VSAPTLVVPVRVGAADKTTEPVPVDVVVPVPPSATANAVVKLSVAILVVPVRVGAIERTTEPVPVDVVHAGAADTVPVPVCERNAVVADTEPGNLEMAAVPDAYGMSPSTYVD
jgi:hypothetical protein